MILDFIYNSTCKKRQTSYVKFKYFAVLLGIDFQVNIADYGP